jgi:hypothetical protein
MVTNSQDGKSTLLLWLNLLGWQVEVKRVGNKLVGVARHCAADGSSFRVVGSAPTRDELAFRLFEAAMKIIESREPRRRLGLLAA